MESKKKNIVGEAQKIFEEIMTEFFSRYKNYKHIDLRISMNPKKNKQYKP